MDFTSGKHGWNLLCGLSNITYSASLEKSVLFLFFKCEVSVPSLSRHEFETAL